MKKDAAKNAESPTELLDARIEALVAWRGAAAKLNTSKGRTPTCPCTERTRNQFDCSYRYAVNEQKTQIKSAGKRRMPIFDFERHRAEKLIAEYCEQRIPAHARHQVQLIYKRRGNAFVLFERRPYWLDETRFVDMDIARIAYNQKDREWRLQYKDRNERWQSYIPFEQLTTVEDILDEIDADPTGIFWG